MIESGCDGKVFERCAAGSGIRIFRENPTFARLSAVIACTVVVFVLLISGTATTAIAFPPEPARFSNDCLENALETRTALDGNYKLIGPLLVMAGGFLLVLDVFLCFVLTKNVYVSSRTVRPVSDTSGVTLLGGPFYLALPTSVPNAMEKTWSRPMWAMPNAPTPDFSIGGDSPKGGKVRPFSASVVKCSQLPYNPDVQ